MHPGASTSQARLWLVSLAASVGINALVIVCVAVFSARARNTVQAVLSNKLLKEDEPVVVLAPMMEALAPKPDPQVAPPAPERQTAPLQRSTTGTSATQESARPDKFEYEGEHNTRATSNAAPVEGAPAVPSLRGADPEDGRKAMTFDSQYRDGEGDHAGRGDAETAPAAQSPVAATPETPAPSPATPPAGKIPQVAKPGTAAVDRQNLPKADDVPTPPPEPVKKAEAAPENQTPKPQQDNGLSSESQPTRVEGSVSVAGVGSQDVGDTPRGRYNAAVTRAIERYWQANLARNRNYMAVGSVRVVILLETSGKVRSVSFVDQYGIGEVQKGVIQSSIRDHPLPAMPADVSRTVKPRMPYELAINFIFGS